MKDAGIRITATGSVRDTYTLDAGRCIVKNGTPLCTLHGVGAYDPTELDSLARYIVVLLNDPRGCKHPNADSCPDEPNDYWVCRDCGMRYPKHN